MLALMVSIGLLTGAGSETVIPPVVSGGGGGLPRHKLTRKQEDSLEKAIDELLALEIAVKQARTPRLREKKIKQAVTIAETLQDTVQDELPALGFVSIDLSGMIAEVRPRDSTSAEILLLISPRRLFHASLIASINFANDGFGK